MSIAETPAVPIESGKLDGIAYCLWAPGELEAPAPAVLVFHGGGSCKENHSDFARAAAGHGFVALTFDNLGHGETERELGPSVADDVAMLARFLAERPEVNATRVAARGSSMGGLMAIHAGAESDDVAAVVAICPASERAMLPMIRRAAEGEQPAADSYLAAIRLDAAGLVPWLESRDVFEAAERISPKPLLLIHAKGDDVVPCARSEELYERAGEPKGLWLLEGGDHRSAQHDTEIQGESLRWLANRI